MTPDRWQHIKAILDEVLQCPPADQPGRLDALCADDAALRSEVESLLRADADAPAFLDGDAAALGLRLFDGLAPDETIDASGRIGPYRLVDEIGAGGMGIVYRAERADGHFNQEVALKVLPRYFETEERLARFRAERQILASLNHPNIARLLDGGVTSAGHPYLVMEYVEGVPITEYCARHDASIRERVQLLQRVGRAVQHAHSNLVVHRDLKPPNILVTKKGRLKLLDFGIAKLLAPETVPSAPPTTGVGQFLMTPEYAAPEQVRGGDVTTATDVYQLGALAYELLSGRRPFDVDGRRLPALRQAILETHPTAPSAAVVDTNAERASSGLPQPAAQWGRSLRGDLDDVVMKALRKESSHRYASAEAVVDDLDRALTNRPIKASPPTVRYRLRKFVRRHRGAVLASLAGVLLLAGMSVLYTLQIQNERDRARAEAQKSEEIASFLMALFEANDPTETLGDTIRARTLLNRGLERADALTEQPVVQAQLFEVVGHIYGRLGRFEQGESVLRRAIRTRTRAHGSSAPETVASRESLGVLLGDAGEYEAAERVLREVLDARETRLRDDPGTRAETKRHLAYVLRRQGQYEAAKALLEESLPVVESHVGEHSARAVEIRSSLGVVLQNMGEYDKCESLYRSVLAERRRQLASPHPKLAMSINSLATLLMNVGHLEEAESLFREALEMREALFGPDHPKVALTVNNLALVHRRQAHYRRAEPLFHRALSIRRTQLGKEHVSVAISLFGLAGLLHRTDRRRPALDAYEEALALFRTHLGRHHSFVARTQMGIGSVHLDLGNSDAAAESLRTGFDRVRRIHSDSSIEYALGAGRLGRFHLERGDTSRAKSLLTEGLTTLKAIEKSVTPRQQILARHLTRLAPDP